MNKKILIPIGLLLLDQSTKKLVVWKNLPHLRNSNLFFTQIPPLLLIILSAIFLTILFLWLKKASHQKNYLFTLSLLLIFTGGLSNLYDRITLNFVIDWIYLPFFPFSVLNLADIYITTGLILSILPTQKNKLDKSQ